MMYYYHSYYYYYILLLPILLYIRKSVHQKCMIILWYYIQNWQLLERDGASKNGENFLFFCVFFLRKKMMSFCFLMIVCHFFECIFDFWTKKCYLWLIFIIIALRKICKYTSFVCEKNWKKKYLLSLNSCEYELLSFVMIQINNWKKMCVWMKTKQK